MKHLLLKYFSLIWVLVLGFVLRILAINIDPFLHPWDERFHALVARNMMHNPVVPILRVNPITDNYDKFIWCCNHIWVHKQPLFMWQMAASMKIFGVSEWSMRIPSAIMGTILILLVYRIIIILTKNKRVALLTAFMLAVSNFHLQMISGIHGMDHNDVAHGFYVMASIWAFFEYKKSDKSKNRWWILIGVFAGAAILNKWLTGLLVFGIWSVVSMVELLQKKNIRKDVLYGLLSLLICCIVFIPWQLYILNAFPELARYEYEFNRRHITEALEGHEGGNFYYVKFLGTYYGNYLYMLLPLGMIASFFNKKINPSLNIGLFMGWLVVVVFFSFIVQTKVDTYLFFMVPIGMYYIALLIDTLIQFTKNNNIIKVVTLCVYVTIGYLIFNPKWIINYLSDQNVERNNRIYNADIYRNLTKELPANVKVVMNINSFEDIDVMFYNDVITAYHWTLLEEDFVEFKKKKIPIAVFKNHGKYEIPLWAKEYPYLYVIDKDIKSMY